jgi:hypothetical protein
MSARCWSGPALGKLLPGGTLTALPAEVRILQQASVDAAVATAASLTSGVIASPLLVVVLPIAAAVALAGGQGGGAALRILGVSVGTLSWPCWHGSAPVTRVSGSPRGSRATPRSPRAADGAVAHREAGGGPRALPA